MYVFDIHGLIFPEICIPVYDSLVIVESKLDLNTADPDFAAVTAFDIQTSTEGIRTN